MQERKITNPDQIPPPNKFLSRKKGPEWIESRGKRRLDLAIAVPMLAVAAPIEVAARAAIRIEERGENKRKRKIGEKIEPTVFYSERVGTKGQTINVRKIRTMKQCSYPESDFATMTPEDGNGNVTMTGRFLRRHDLDEMPQVWQVVRGEMTLFGHARPVLQSDLDVLYGEKGQTARLNAEEISTHKKMREAGKPALVTQGVIYDRAGMRSKQNEKMGLEWDKNYFENASLGRDLRLFGRESSQKALHLVQRSRCYASKRLKKTA